MPLTGCVPWRGFTWRQGQFHRPGLESVLSTGRQHAFESHREDQFLAMADFTGDAEEMLSQPFLLEFQGEGGWREHIPDFLLVSRRGRWLVDVRPAGRMDDDDLMKFAATSEVALALGWGYAVVTGWRPLTWRNVDLLYSRRRPMQDRLGLKPMLLQTARAAQALSQPLTFRALADSYEFPSLARPVILHLLWHRQLGVDLAAPFGDSSILRVARRPFDERAGGRAAGTGHRREPDPGRRGMAGGSRRTAVRQGAADVRHGDAADGVVPHARPPSSLPAFDGGDRVGTASAAEDRGRSHRSPTDLAADQAGPPAGSRDGIPRR
ncbi:TnsA-like heteromeric transposase endonuclease subunit [Streptomyces nogalater]